MPRTVAARLRALTRTMSVPAARRFAQAAVAAITVTLAAVAAVLPGGAAAEAADGGSRPVVLAVNSLPQVIANTQAWILGILWALAGLYAVIGGVYRLTAGGDPAQVEKGNAALLTPRSAPPSPCWPR